VSLRNESEDRQQGKANQPQGKDDLDKGKSTGWAGGREGTQAWVDHFVCSPTRSTFTFPLMRSTTIWLVM
jgi:hypothetical protein